MILYSNHCSKCNALKQMLDKKGVIYDFCDDVTLMKEKRFMSAPKLELDNGDILDFVQSMNWISNDKGVN